MSVHDGPEDALASKMPPMTQNDNELQIVDPLEAVRRLEGLFFRGGRFSPAESVAHLGQECLPGRATTISIRNVGDWWMIGGMSTGLHRAPRRCLSA